MKKLQMLASAGFVVGLLTMGLGSAGSMAAVSRSGKQSTAGMSRIVNQNTRPDLGVPSQFVFQTIDNPADKTFNQLLGINDSYVIAGYYGSGMPPTTHPNKGYMVAWPYTHSDYAKENFPGAQQTQAIGINNGGAIVGFFADANGDNFGFTHVGGHFTKIVDPHTPKSKPGSPVVNQLLGINNHGIAAGFYNDAKGHSHGYTYDINNHSFHGVSPGGATSVTAAGINDKGDVAGFLTKANGDTAGFLEHSGHFTVFEYPGSTNTLAFGMDNADIVVGSYVDSSNATHGFVDAGGSFHQVDDPKAAPGTTIINGINNHYSLVGFANDAAGNTIGFEANPKRDHAFHTLDNHKDPTFNQLLGINDHKVIAGYFGSGSPANTHPNKGYVLSPPYGQKNYTNENYPGSKQTQVTGINNAGDTVGFYVNAAGANFGFTRIQGHFTKVVDPLTPKSTSKTPAVNQLLGLNNHNVAAGFYVDKNGNAHGYEYNANNHSFKAITPPHATSVTATGINDQGEVSGFLTESNGNVATFLNHGAVHFAIVEFPGSKNTTAFGINNKAQMVGSYVDSGGMMHGFLYTDGTFQSMDDPKGTGSTVINGLNNNADLVGFYTDAGGNTDGFEADPK